MSNVDPYMGHPKYPRWVYLCSSLMVFPISGVVVGVLVIVDPFGQSHISAIRVVGGLIYGLALTGMGLGAAQLIIQGPEPLVGYPRIAERKLRSLRRAFVGTLIPGLALAIVGAALKRGWIAIPPAVAGIAVGCYVLWLLATEDRSRP